MINVLANDNVLPGPGAALTITDVSTNAIGTVTINSAGNRLHYVPQPGFVGVDLFNYDIADGVGGTAMGLVRVRVIDAGLNANDDIFTVPRNARDVVTISVQYRPGAPFVVFTGQAH